MKRILLTVAYDGTGYSGFQAQKSGVPTIERELNRALTELTGAETEVSGASRTDAGVHALCNLAVFDTESRIPPEKFANALNVRLPEQIRVQNSREVPADFHPRFCDTVKTYDYVIYNAPFPSPRKSRYSHYSYTPFDVEKMREAAEYLTGMHDYRSFCGNSKMKKSTVRVVDVIRIEESGSYIRFYFHGNGFLQHMVRIMVGTLLQVGLGEIEPGQMADIIEGKNRSLAGPTAPARGLCLMKVDY
jgi:tRNA pseudouridine38-40 synthase